MRSQSGESANTVSKSIVAYYCCVIYIAASFSGFIIQLLVIFLVVALKIRYVAFLFVYICIY